jgi:hypothetical protein
MARRAGTAAYRASANEQLAEAQQCDCRLVAAAITSVGPIIQPTRQPVIA